MKGWLIEHKLSIMITAILTAGGIYYFNFYNQAPSEISSIDNIENKSLIEPKKVNTETEEQPEKIMVDVKGQIKNPGVYPSSIDERVTDVVNRAGGFTEKADKDQVNLAEHVHDEMVIYIPAKGEDVKSELTSASTSANTGGTEGKLDLNKADINSLQTLPGIGPAKAAAIIDYREKNGKFKTEEDLKNISGIGDKTFEKLKDLIVVH